jgi:septum formation protein
VRTIYLASRSPRRRQLLELAGILYEVLDIDIDETPLAGEGPLAYAERVAQDKAAGGWALVLAQARVPRPVLAADTTVAVDGRILGKPSSAESARAMLRALSGRRHEVYTVVVMQRNEQVEQVCSESVVQFGEITLEEIDAYVASGEPMDKAGAYAIQGAAQRFVERVEGSVSGIMGLPLCETLRLLKRFDAA